MQRSERRKTERYEDVSRKTAAARARAIEESRLGREKVNKLIAEFGKKAIVRITRFPGLVKIIMKLEELVIVHGVDIDLLHEAILKCKPNGVNPNI